MAAASWLVAAWLVAPALGASPSKAAEAGLEAFSTSNLDLALRELDEALEKPEKVRAELLAEAYLVRGIVRTRLAGEQPEYIVLAVDDLIAADLHDAPDALSDRISDASRELFDQLEVDGNAKVNAGDHAAARPLLEAQVKLRPTSVESRYQLCVTADAVDDAELVEAQCARALELAASDGAAVPDPLYAQAALLLSQARREAGDTDGAIAAVDEGLKLQITLDQRRQKNRDLYSDAEWAQAETTRDGVREKLGKARLVALTSDPDKAAESVDTLRAAVEEDPGNAQLQLNLASTLVETGDVDGAIAAFEAGLALDDSQPTPHVQLANLYVKRAMEVQEAEGPDEELVAWMEKAVAPLTRALELKPDDEGIAKGLLQACEVTGDQACIDEVTAKLDE